MFSLQTQGAGQQTFKEQIPQYCVSMIRNVYAKTKPRGGSRNRTRFRDGDKFAVWFYTSQWGRLLKED